MNIEETESRWEPVRQMMENAKPVTLGSMHSYQMRNTPGRILYTSSYYKFASKMIGQKKTVLDIGCGEGLGTWLIAKECGSAHGLDFDQDLIQTAKENWTEDFISFDCQDFHNIKDKTFDAAINFDVIEHIQPQNAKSFIQGMANCLTPYGIAIVGTPNITTQKYASKVTNAGHINLYDHDRLKQEMQEVFTQVIMFGANDEVVHTGFPPMCQYLIAVGIRKK